MAYKDSLHHFCGVSPRYYRDCPYRLFSWGANMLTLERLKEVLNFDLETGIFNWKQKRGSKPVGSIAGAPQNKGYIQIMIDNRNYLAHRLAWFYVYGEWPKNQIDHINRIKTDNSIKNLRDVDGSTNLHNVGTRSHNTSGVNGVYWSNRSKKWICTIEINTKKHWLGSFSTLEDAKKCRELKNKQLS